LLAATTRLLTRLAAILLLAAAAPAAASPDDAAIRGLIAGDLSREELAGKSEIMVEGVVEAIEVSKEIHDDYEELSLTATLRILRVELGTDLSVGDTVRVQYWWRDLDRPIPNLAVGFTPLPQVGEVAWLFAKSVPEQPGTLHPIMPNGWSIESPIDPLPNFGGTVVEEIDHRSPPLWPWGLVFIAAGVPPLAWSLRADSQSKGPLRLLAAGLALVGVAMLFF
jgi:hypothetical protein